MIGQAGTAVQALRAAILRFGEAHPQAIRRFRSGDRVIHQGTISEECFLITEGSLSVLVQDSASGAEREIVLRVEGDLIGETAFLQRNAPRTASVQVASSEATLIRLTRSDIFGLLREDQALQDAVSYLWELSSARKRETGSVLEGKIRSENRVMSVLMADIHNFSALGETTWEEETNAFLFDFVDEANRAAAQGQGDFQDQGDGFKILFRGAGHADRALECADVVRVVFMRMRAEFVERNDAFNNMGLGVGICTDCMSVRCRTDTPTSVERVFSHAINIAAAISKLRSVPSDVDVWIDENTRDMASAAQFVIAAPSQKYLDKLSRFCKLYAVARAARQKETDAAVAQERSAPQPSQQEPAAVGPISILFLAAEPSDAARLHLEAEARTIQQKLQLSRYRERFTFHHVGAALPEDLSQALLDLEPQVVHFSGHGTENGELCFEDAGGKARPVSPQSLAALFREFAGAVQCVVLNACYSERQADAIAEHVRVVIGMPKAISNSAATAFAIGLYQALGAGKTYEEAYRLGCVQVAMHVGADAPELAPVLKSRQARNASG